MSTEYWLRRIRYPPIAGGIDWPWPFDQIAWWFGQVWAWLGGLWDWVTGAIWGAIRSMVENLPGWFTWVRDRVGEVASGLWNWITDRAGWVRDRVAEIAGWLWNNIYTWLVELWTKLSGLGGEAWQAVNALWRWLGDSLGALGTGISQLWGWIGDELGNWGREIERVSAEHRDDIKAYAGQGFDRQRLDVGEMIEGAKQFFAREVIDPWTDWLRSTVDAFVGGMRGVWSMVSGWLDQTWQFFLNRIGGPLFDAGSRALGWLGDRLGDLGRFSFDLVTQFLFSHSPVQISQVPNKARDLVIRMGASVGGLIAMTLGGELLHPLKNIGLGNVAAMVYNFTRYDTIIDNYVRPIASGAIGTPLRYYVNDYLRPWRPSVGELIQLFARGFITRADFGQGMAWQGLPDDWIEAFAQLAKVIPSEGTLGTMYAKKEIDERTLREALGRWGYSRDWQDVYTRHLWLDPRLGEIIRISQISPPSPQPDPQAISWLQRAGIPLGDTADWWYTYKLAKAGYEPIDVSVLVGVAKMGVVRREQTLYFDAARRLRRDGFVDDKRYELLVAEAWVAKDPVTFRRAATALDVEYARKESLATCVRRAFSRGALTAAEALEALGRLGMDAVAARIALLEERLGLLPRTRLALVTAVGEEEDAGD